MPTMPGTECPSVMELEVFLTQSGGDERTAQHLETCSRCRAALDEIRANNELMVGLAGSSITPQHVDSQSGPPPTGQITPAIEGYIVHGEIHRGGQGVVYRATQRATNRTVALKVLTAGVLATSQQRRRFEREIDLVAQLQHPNIVTLYDSGQTRDGCHYFAMQHIEGVPLDDYVRRQPIRQPARGRDSVERPLRLFGKICAAVTCAHQRGVIHRDLKPSNILVDADGQPHVLDFGLAKTLDTDTSESQLTMTDAFLGTLAYASPEQTQGIPGLVDTRSDVYSLGVILYQMLTGHFPYAVVGTVAQVLRNIAEAEPQRPSSWHQRESQSSESVQLSSLSCKVDGELETIILTALAKDPERRYQSADALRRDVEHYLSGEPITARPPSVVYQLRKFAQRNKALVGGVVAVVVVLVLGVIGTSVGMARAVAAHESEAKQREIAESERDRARTAEDLAEQRLGQAVAARSAEEQARRRAEAELAKARAVNQFLQDMLAAADPEQARGREVTVEDALSAAAKQVENGSLADQPEVEAAVRSTIGVTYLALGLHPPAEPHLRRALELCQDLHGHEHPETLLSMNNLAELHAKQGRYDEAEPLYVQALEVQRRTLGEEHSDTLTSMNNLAGLYVDQGRYDEAEQLYAATLESRRRLLGEEHRDTLLALGNLGGLYWRLGRYEEAEALYRQALEHAPRVLGEDHPDTLTAMGNLGALCWQQGRYDEAEQLYRQALEVQTRVLGEEHPHTLILMSNLAGLYNARGHYEEAEKLLIKVLQAQRRAVGEEHPHTLVLMINLAKVYEAQGRYEEAEQLYTRALEVQRRVLGEEHPSTLYALNSLAELYTQQGRYDAAEPLFVKALKTRRRVLGDEHPHTLESLYGLSVCLIRAEKFAQARPHAEQHYELHKAVYGPDDPQTINAIRLLVRLYDAWGKPDQATQWRDRLPSDSEAEPA